MTEHSPAVYALQKLHAELGGRLKQNAADRRRLVEDMKHVEAVLHLLEPGFNARKIAARRRNRGNPTFKRGEVWRTALDVLRRSPEPMTARQITEAMYHAKGIADPTSAQIRSLFAGVNSSLRNHAGRTVETVNDGMPARWRVIKGDARTPFASIANLL